MVYKEEQGNLFDLGSDYWYCQCISADFGMGAGIAVEFNNRFNQKNRMKQLYTDYEATFSKIANMCHNYGECLPDNEAHVFNLVTKVKCWDKPTHESLFAALYKMKTLIESYKDTDMEIKKLAMPRIGCGIDKLNWEQVSYSIQYIFTDMDIEIVVRYL